MLEAGHRRLLDAQRPAPRVPQRPARRAQRRAGARDAARPGAPARRRDRPDRRHARGAARAPAGGQGLSRRAHRRRAQRLLPDREPGRAARGRAAPGRRRGRVAGASSLARRAARPSASGCWRSSSRSPSAQRLVRRAWRSAQRLGAELDVLWVQPPGRAPNEERARALAALRQLTSVLGANLIVRESDDVVEAAAEEIRERGTTYVLDRRVRRRAAGSRRLRDPLPQRLMRAAPARRRRPHRRRPEGEVSPLDVDRRRSSRSSLGAGGGFRYARTAARAAAAAPAACAGSCCRSPAPRSPAARSTPRCGSRAPRTRRSSPPSWPPSRATSRSTPPCPRQCSLGMPLLEAIEQAATSAEIPVDARVGRGRTYRHALARLLDEEPVDRVIVPAGGDATQRPVRRRPRLAARAGAGRGADPARRLHRPPPRDRRRGARSLLSAPLARRGAGDGAAEAVVEPPRLGNDHRARRALVT